MFRLRLQGLKNDKHHGRIKWKTQIEDEIETWAMEGIHIYIYANPPPPPRTNLSVFQNSKTPKFQKNPVNFLEIPKFQNPKIPKGNCLLEFQKIDWIFLEFWNFGILEFWNFGILEFWNFGILEFWNFGISEFWNWGILEFGDFGTLEFLEFWNFGISQNLTGEFTIPPSNFLIHALSLNEQ